MLQRFRERLVLVLIILLPFHAFLVTVGTRLLAGAGQAPLPWLVMWKEAVLALVMALAVMEFLRTCRAQNARCRMDVFDLLVVGLLMLGVVTTNDKLLTPHSLFGAKYTLFPLFLFLLLRRVSWSDDFFCLSSSIFLLLGAVVAVYGFLTFFLPPSFFTWLGYSDLHSTYLPDGPLAAFQYLEGMGIRRMQATFAGPNQLGVWLLIPWSIAVAKYMECWRVSHFDRLNVTRLLPLVVFGTALLFTFSRAAWIGAAAIVLVAFWYCFPRRARCWLLVAGCWLLVVLFATSVITRPQSTAEHFRRPLEALLIIAQHPLGLGLGAAGPAANRTGDPCVYFAEGADVSWATDRPNLCVFVGGKQVQPLSRACQCPFLPENWYLQVGVELGVVGLVLFVVFVLAVLFSLGSDGRMFVFPPFLGISIAALFLHAWEDSAVAYTMWILVAMALPLRLSSPKGGS